jgi:hypothetical protein
MLGTLSELDQPSLGSGAHSLAGASHTKHVGIRILYFASKQLPDSKARDDYCATLMIRSSGTPTD